MGFRMPDGPMVQTPAGQSPEEYVRACRRAQAHVRRLEETAARFGVVSIGWCTDPGGEQIVRYYRPSSVPRGPGDRRPPPLELLTTSLSASCGAGAHGECSGDGDEPGPCPCRCHIEPQPSSGSLGP